MPGVADEEPLRAGDLTIDLAAKMVCRDGQQVRLTPTEWSILELLARNHGKLVSRRELLHHIWGPSERKETSYLRVYLGQLRHKLEADPARPRHLITEAGMDTGSVSDPASRGVWCASYSGSAPMPVPRYRRGGSTGSGPRAAR